MALYERLHGAIEAGRVASSHTPTLGGLAVGLALCAIGGDLGAEIDLRPAGFDGITDDALLFSESNSRFILTCAPEQQAAFEAHFAGQPLHRVGVVTAGPMLTVTATAGVPLIQLDTARLRKSFQTTLQGM